MSEYGRRWQRAWDGRLEARRQLAKTYRQLADALAQTDHTKIAELTVLADRLRARLEQLNGQVVK